MSVAILGSLIIWLIIAVIVIAIVVYFVNWLYRRSSKELSFVRTGLFGEKVVINSGAFVLPFIHEVTPVNMNVLRMQVVRNRDDALITKDRMRVDIESEFYVRVPPTPEAVTIAAATLGRRTTNVADLDALLSGKFVSALRSVASEMTNAAASTSPGSRNRPWKAWRRTGLSSSRSRSPISTRPTSNSSIRQTASMPRA